MTHDLYDHNLKSFPRPKPLLDFEDVPFFGGLPELLRNVKKSLGLDIVFVRAGATLPDMMARYFSVKVEGGKSPGSLALLPSKNIKRSFMSVSEQEEFVTSLALLLGDAYRWQQMFRRYEEELASLIPAPSLDPQEHRFTETLFSIIKEGGKILDFQAASLYLLDEKQSTLKLRSCWGLPEERLLAPPRSLHESLADLEAILGQVVILNENYLMETWMPPEDFSMAVCLPIASPVTIIGTLWFFSDQRRECTERDVSLMEIIAGRLAAELERAAILRGLEMRDNEKKQQNGKLIGLVG
ncbi:MAG: GAF domain-containing protein [Thermoguttaceae bacterium]